YPITGRLVAAAVRNAFKDLVDQLNSRLDNTLSADRWRAKFKAAVSGRSEAEILLSEGAAFEIIDLLLINRQSGLLIAQAGLDADKDDSESHVLGSILTAIMAFVRDAMSESSEQDLRTLHVGDLRLHLQVSPGAILAIKTKGPPPAGFETALNEIFYDFLARWGHLLSDPDQIEGSDAIALTEDLETRFQSLQKARQTNFKGPSKKAAIVLGAIALVAVFWIGWMIFDGWHEDRIETQVRTVLQERRELAGYPIEADYRRDDDTVVISGLFPSEESVASLRMELEDSFPVLPLVMNVGVLPEVEQPDSVTPADLDVMEDRVSDFAEAIAALEGRLPAAPEAELAELRLWLHRQSIRFDDDISFRNESEAVELLETIADRLSVMPDDVGLLVVGYADDLGEDSLSARISRSRARSVAERLADLGTPSERLQAVGRGKEERVSDIDGVGSINRRVEFELIYLSNRNASKNGRPGADDGDR
ncbi:MAG: OmpA family protein, partial [Pseudomonadota bacterium]